MSGAENLFRSMREAASRLWETYRTSKIDRYVIIGFFLTNFLFIFLHVIVSSLVALGYAPESLKPYLAIDRDGSIPEVFNYLQAIGCVVFLFRAFRASGQPVYLGWALVFGFVFIDDAQELHERIGTWLTQIATLPRVPYMRVQDTGELIVWGAAGALLLPVLAYGFWKSTREAVGFGALFALIFALLLFCAIGVDMLHSAIGIFGTWWRVAHALLAIAEDGGEMLVLGLAFAFSLLLYRRSSIVADADKRSGALQAVSERL